MHGESRLKQQSEIQSLIFNPRPLPLNDRVCGPSVRVLCDRDLSSFQRPQHLQPLFLTLKCGCVLVVARWLCTRSAIARISWGTISRMSFHLVPLFSATSCKEGITQVSQLVRLSTILHSFSCLPTYNHTCDWFFCYVIHRALAPGPHYLISLPLFIKTLIKKVFIKKTL